MCVKLRESVSHRVSIVRVYGSVCDGMGEFLKERTVVSNISLD